MRCHRIIVTAAAAAGLLVAAPLAAAAPEPAGHVAWTQVASPNPLTSSGAQDLLSAVRCHSATSCIAGGSLAGPSSDGTTELLLRWQGKVWKSITPPGSNAMKGVAALACPSDTWCMAVGNGDVPNHGYRPAAQLVEGNTVHAASAGFTTPKGRIGFLSGVSCRSRSFCIAVGQQQGDQTVYPLIAKWNGHHWTAMKSPNPGLAPNYAGGQEVGSWLDSVSCVTKHDCIAVGTSSKITSVKPTMQDVTHTFNFVLKYDGHRWLTMSAPDVAIPGSSEPQDDLTSVACRSASECFATGNSTHVGVQHGYIEHWNGAAWHVVYNAHQNTYELTAISCGTTSNCDATSIDGNGVRSSPTYSKIFQWNGSTWNIEPIHAPSTTQLGAVSCSSATQCFAVGTDAPTVDDLRTLTLAK